MGQIIIQWTRSYFWGFTPLCQVWWKSTKKCDRESDDTRTDRQTDRHTDRQTQTDFIICPIAICYSYGADNNVLISCRSLILAKCELNELTPTPSYMCLSAVARSYKLCIVVSIDYLVCVQCPAVVRCDDMLLQIPCWIQEWNNFENRST